MDEEQQTNLRKKEKRKSK